METASPCWLLAINLSHNAYLRPHELCDMHRTCNCEESIYVRLVEGQSVSQTIDRSFKDIIHTHKSTTQLNWCQLTHGSPSHRNHVTVPAKGGLRDYICTIIITYRHTIQYTHTHTVSISIMAMTYTLPRHKSTCNHTDYCTNKLHYEYLL